LKITPWTAAALSSLPQEVSWVVAFGGSSSSIFVHTKLKIRLPTSPAAMPRMIPNGL
jgi:hypothetical protein